MKTAMKQSAVKQPPAALITLLKDALAHQQNGSTDKAETLYKNVLKSYSAFGDAVYMACLFFAQLGKHRYALTHLDKALKKTPHDTKLLVLAARCALDLVEYDKALQFTKKALQLSPALAEAYYIAGRCYQQINQSAHAISHLETALAQNSLPQAMLIDCTNRYAAQLLLSGNIDTATQRLEALISNNLISYDTFLILSFCHTKKTKKQFETLMQAITFTPSEHQAKALLAQCLHQGYMPEKIIKAHYDICNMCLDSDMINHQDLQNLWARCFEAFILPQNAQDLFKQPNYKRFCELFDEEDNKKALTHRFFLKGLRTINIFNQQLETLVTHMRRDYLDKVHANEPLSPEDITALQAISEQCYLNEYVLDASQEEETRIKAVKTRLLEAKTADKLTNELLVYSTYADWKTLSNWHDLLGDKPLNNNVLDTLHALHIRHPLKEQTLGKSIAQLSPIHDDTSLKVQNMYEENPYPRWISCNMFTPLQYKYVDNKYLPHKDILVAGCGTGLQVVHEAIMNPQARITAIDLSHASLCYAKRKVQALGLDNVKFIQADLLDADKLKQKFDYINCAGVLHHMQNPTAGLAALKSVLKPNGVLFLALYSELGRQSIVEARKIIKNQNFSTAYQDIRLCRSFIKEHKELDDLMKRRDFYALSQCRDLLFHVQEIRYSVNDISNMLDECELIFEGFTGPQFALQEYANTFPDDKNGTNLKNWSSYEQSKPATFAKMYQFYAKYRTPDV